MKYPPFVALLLCCCTSAEAQKKGGERPTIVTPQKPAKPMTKKSKSCPLNLTTFQCHACKEIK